MFSYDGDLTQPLNQARLLSGDVDATDPQLQDEEWSVFLPGGVLSAGSIYLAAAQGCETIASRYARQVTTKLGSFTANLSDRQDHYLSRARDLRRQHLRMGSIAPFLGGATISGKQTIEADTDRVQPEFTVTTGDDEGGGSGTEPVNSIFWPN